MNSCELDRMAFLLETRRPSLRCFFELEEQHMYFKKIIHWQEIQQKNFQATTIQKLKEVKRNRQGDGAIGVPTSHLILDS